MIREGSEEEGDLPRFFLYGEKMKHAVVDRSGKVLTTIRNEIEAYFNRMPVVRPQGCLQEV